MNSNIEKQLLDNQFKMIEQLGSLDKRIAILEHNNVERKLKWKGWIYLLALLPAYAGIAIALIGR